MNRHKLFDQARGLAIIAMVMANSAPVLAENVEVGFWFRLLCSFPAPVFVVVAGAMVALTAPKHNLAYFVQRGLFVLGMGALIDLAANMMLPFQGFDVLYLIGIMTPLAFLANKLKNFQLIALIGTLFLVSFGLQRVLGYQEFPRMIYLSGEIMPENATIFVWKHWLIDGWFPLLPWLPLGFCGILFARLYQSSAKSGASFGFATAKFVLASTVVVGLGLWITMLAPSPFFVRYGYVELFYPPSIGFVVTALGVVGLIFALSEFTSARLRFGWFQLFGSMTLAMYTLHLMVIGHIYPRLFYPIPDFWTFYLIFVVHVAGLTFVAHGIRFARETFVGMPLLIKWLIGK